MLLGHIGNLPKFYNHKALPIFAFYAQKSVLVDTLQLAKKVSSKWGHGSQKSRLEYLGMNEKEKKRRQEKSQRKSIQNAYNTEAYTFILKSHKNRKPSVDCH